MREERRERTGEEKEERRKMRREGKGEERTEEKEGMRGEIKLIYIESLFLGSNQLRE